MASTADVWKLAGAPGTAAGFVKVETKWAGGSDWTTGGVSDWAVGLAVVGTEEK